MCVCVCVFMYIFIMFALNVCIHECTFIAVLDMARHIPLFNALMENIRALASNFILIPLLLPKSVTPTASTAVPGQSGSADQLLARLRDCADTYMNRLK